jgi:hypothetical protein
MDRSEPIPKRPLPRVPSVLQEKAPLRAGLKVRSYSKRVRSLWPFHGRRLLLAVRLKGKSPGFPEAQGFEVDP